MINEVLVLKRNIPQDLDSFTQSVMYPFVGLSADGRVINWRTKSLLKPSIDDGYLRFCVKVNGKSKGVVLHRLIAERFVLRSTNPDATQVNHIDGNKLNNDPSNLEWVTLIDNVIHANKIGLRDSCKGFNHYGCKVTEQLVNNVCLYMTLHLPNKDIDTFFDLPAGFCNDIRRGKSWPEISVNYDIPVKSNKASIFYLLELNERYLKFGVTNNLERRLIDIKCKSKRFTPKLLYSYDLCCSVKSRQIESIIRQSGMIETSVVSKEELPFGFSETAYTSSLQDIIQLVENYKPT